MREAGCVTLKAGCRPSIRHRQRRPSCPSRTCIMRPSHPASRIPHPVRHCRGGRCSRCSQNFRLTRLPGLQVACCSSPKVSPCCALPPGGAATRASSVASTVAGTGIPIGCISRCTRMAYTGWPTPGRDPTSPATSFGTARRWRTTRRAWTARPSLRATPCAKRSMRRGNGPGYEDASVRSRARSFPARRTCSMSWSWRVAPNMCSSCRGTFMGRETWRAARGPRVSSRTSLYRE